MGSWAWGAAVWWHAVRSQSDSARPATVTPEFVRRSGLQAVSQRGAALGTETTITALHSDATVARKAVAAAMAELRRVEEIMSLYQPESQLSKLNRSGWLQKPHPYLLDILRQCANMSQRSRGAFDVTVQPLWEVYFKAQQAQGLPAGEAVEDCTAPR